MSAPASDASEIEHGAIGAQRERLAERPQRGLRAHADDDDLAVRTGRALLQAEGLLDRVRVERVQRALTRAVEPRRRGIDAARGGRVRHFLDADGDLQAELPPGAPAREARGLRDDGSAAPFGALASIATGPWFSPRGELRRKSTIVAVGAPGVKIAATPRSRSACASAVGIVPPSTTSTSSASASRSSSRMRGHERHVGAREDRDADRVRVLLHDGLGDLLGRLMQSRVDHLHARIAQRAGDHLGAAVVPVETRLGDHHPDRSFHDFSLRPDLPTSAGLRPPVLALGSDRGTRHQTCPIRTRSSASAATPHWTRSGSHTGAARRYLHPDRFATSSDGVRSEAARRMLQLNGAMEAIEVERADEASGTGGLGSVSFGGEVARLRDRRPACERSHRRAAASRTAEGESRLATGPNGSAAAADTPPAPQPKPSVELPSMPATRAEARRAAGGAAAARTRRAARLPRRRRVASWPPAVAPAEAAGADAAADSPEPRRDPLEPRRGRRRAHRHRHPRREPEPEPEQRSYSLHADHAFSFEDDDDVRRPPAGRACAHASARRAAASCRR